MFLSDGWLKAGVLVKQAVQAAESVHQRFFDIVAPSQQRGT
jgi:hypothetical protein